MPRFRTPEVAAIFEEVGKYGHAENPFLDASYSLGGFYPVTDFTQTIAEWLLQGRTAAIGELWSYLTSNGPAEQAMLRMAMAANVIPELGLDDETAAEVKAVHVLGSRLSLYATGHDPVPFEVGRVLGTRLASIEWSPPAETLAHLRKGAEIEALVIPDFDPPERKRMLAEQAMGALLTPLNEADHNLGLWMQRIPPMARLVIADYFHDEKNHLRPQLFYGDRTYGCCAPINVRWISWVGCFEPPGDDADIPHAMTKDRLTAALRRAGVEVEKSASKDRLVAEARRHTGLVRALFAEEFSDYCLPKPIWEPALRRWAARSAALRPIALAVLKSLAMQSSRVRLPV